MTWFDVDGAREYLAQHGGKKPTRKVVYSMVAHGMLVARTGTTGRRMMFCAEWIDAFLIASAQGRASAEIPPATYPGPGAKIAESIPAADVYPFVVARDRGAA